MEGYIFFSTFMAATLVIILSWNIQRWVSLVTLGLLFAGSLAITLDETYFEFSFYLVQVLLVLIGTSFFVRGRNQRLLLGILTFAFVAAGLTEKSLQLDHLASIMYSVYLYSAYALLPLFFYSAVSGREEDLEKMICLQQTWLRVLFFSWALQQEVNISHYDLYRAFILQFGCFALGVILLGVVLPRKLYWTLLQQSVISLLVLSVSLDLENISPILVFTWILLLALAVLLPKDSHASLINRTKFLKRLEFGAFGGGLFWSLVMIVHWGSRSSVEGSILWMIIVFSQGFFSWMRSAPQSETFEINKSYDILNFSLRTVIQILLGILFFIPM